MKPTKSHSARHEHEKAMMKGRVLSVRNQLNVAGLLLILSTTACATAPVPQVTAPPPGQARIWFYRLWDPSESLNAANIDVNGVYLGSVEPGSAFYRDVAPGVYQIVPPEPILRLQPKHQCGGCSGSAGLHRGTRLEQLGECRERCAVVCSSRFLVRLASSATIRPSPDR